MDCLLFHEKIWCEKSGPAFVEDEAIPIFEERMDDIVTSIPENCG